MGKIRAALFTVLVAGFTWRMAALELSFSDGFVSLVTFALLITGYLAFSSAGVIGFLQKLSSGSAWPSLAFPLLLWCIFLAYTAALAEMNLREAGTTLLYLMVPIMILRNAPRAASGLSPFTLLAILVLWLPVEFEWLSDVRIPQPGGIPIVYMLGLLVALYGFLAVYRLDRMGYTFCLVRADIERAALSFALFSAFFAVPIAISLDFVTASRALAGLWQWPLIFLAVFFFTALPEEILFRGLLLNLMRHTWTQRPQAVLTVSSVVFGLAHANNSEPPFVTLPIPFYGPVEVAWVYVILATIAGWFYGLTYLKTDKVTVSALVHAMVNTWWALFFKG